MKYLIFFVLTITSYFGIAQNKEWTMEEIQSAKTADSASYLAPIEKDAIMYINLCRMYPKKFKDLELKGYYGTKKYGDYIKGSPWIASLDSTLDTLSSLQPLTPNDSMSINAKCFAIEQGEAGYTGHERKSCEKLDFAECCSYGMDNGKDIAMQMLIDHNITSLGHRKNCLNPEYIKIGLGFHTHKEWGHCCVIELIDNR